MVTTAGQQLPAWGVALEQRVQSWAGAASVNSSKSIKACFQLRQADFELDVDLQLPGRGVTAIFGHSGSGKTTLLRCIAGLQKPRQGALEVNGDTWQAGNYWLPAHRRPLGYVFQEASLFPHLTAMGNLQYARQRADQSMPVVAFDHVVELLGIGALLDRPPDRLSGGERQRVAIARALLIAPRLLLMDEPLASLDMNRRREILPYLEQLKSELDIPMLYVSHSPDEVARLADHLVALDRGRAVAVGPLEEALARLDFPIRLGEETGVVLSARVVERDPQWKLTRMEFAGGHLWTRDSGHRLGEALRVRVLARDISLATRHHQDSSILNILQGRVGEIATDEAHGVAMVQIHIGESVLVARVTLRSVDHLQLARGDNIWAQIKSVAVLS
ncbi:MAG: molybdenum ABC transporter ATP-binding protein [Gammaproteobacteria bacterium]